MVYLKNIKIGCSIFVFFFAHFILKDKAIVKKSATTNLTKNSEVFFFSLIVVY